MRKENMPGELVEHIGNQVKEYLTKLLKEFKKTPGNDNDSCIQKVEANILLVEQYYNGQNSDIDEDWVRKVCEKMYQGKQRNTINSPLKTILKKCCSSKIGIVEYIFTSKSSITKFKVEKNIFRSAIVECLNFTDHIIGRFQ